jgi:hypothetical protein
MDGNITQPLNFANSEIETVFDKAIECWVVSIGINAPQQLSAAAGLQLELACVSIRLSIQLHLGIGADESGMRLMLVFNLGASGRRVVRLNQRHRVCSKKAVAIARCGSQRNWPREQNPISAVIFHLISDFSADLGRADRFARRL